MSDLMERMFGQMPKSQYETFSILKDPMEYLFPSQKQPAKKWWEQTGEERRKTLTAEQEKLGQLEQQTGIKAAYKPILNVLTVVGGILNIPGAAISSAVKQLVDGSPGFNGQEYFRGIFNFKQQASWRDIIGILAQRDPNKNVWDKKWAQIVSGLILDIALDPTTYFGTGVFKLSKLQQRGLSELVEHGIQLAGKGGSEQLFKRAMMNAGRVWGVSFPFTNKIILPIAKRPQKIMGMLGTVGKAAEAFPEKEFLEALPTAMPTILKIVEKGKIGKWADRLVKRIKPLDWAIGAFEPWKQAHVKAQWTKLESQVKLEKDWIAIDRMITELAKGKDHATLRSVFAAIENMPHHNAAALELVVDNSKYVARLMGKVGKGMDLAGAAEKVFKKRNDLYNIYKMLFREGEKVSPTEIAKRYSQFLDETAVRQIRGFMKRADIDIEDLSGVAKFKAKKDWDTVWNEWGKPLGEEEKTSIQKLVTYIEDTHNKLWDEEFNMGIIKNYKRDYLFHSYGGPVAGRRREMPGAFKPGMHRTSDENYLTKYDSKIKELVASGAAKNEKHAAELLRTKEYGFMVDTVTEAAYLRMIANLKAKYKQNIINGIMPLGREWSRKMGPPPAGWIPVKDVKELKDFVFDADTANYINNALDLFGNDKAIAGFLRAIDKTQGWWKRFVLLYPGYHFRNMYSNWAIGATKHGIMKYGNPQLHKYSWAMTMYKLDPEKKFWKLFGVSDETLDKTFNGKTLRELADEIVLYNVIRGEVRQTGDDVMKNISGMESHMKRVFKKANILQVHSKAAEFVDKLGGAIESEARVASFLLDFDRLGNSRIAAYATNEAFVNYQNLTQFEKQIMRRVVPFWTWLSRNLKNQIGLVFTQPGKMAMLPRVADAMEAGAGWKMPENERPEYFNDLWMWQLPILLPNGDPLFFNPNFPFQDLNKLDPRHFGRNVLATITPFVKVPLELMAGYDIYRKKPLERYKGYKAPVPGILQALVKAFPPESQKILGVEKDERGIMRMNPSVAHAIANLIPFINTSARMFMVEPSPQGMEKYFQFISTAFGIKIKPVDKLTRQWETTREKIEKEREKLKKAGIEVRWNPYKKEWTRVD